MDLDPARYEGHSYGINWARDAAADNLLAAQIKLAGGDWIPTHQLCRVPIL